MKNRKFMLTLALLCIYFIFYLISTIYQSTLWANILSPVGGLLSSIIIFRAYLACDRTVTLNKNWLIFCMASIFWTVADAAWAYYENILRIDPSTINTVFSIYLGTSFSLFAGVAIYAVNKFKKWNGLQLVVDASAVSFTTLFMFWALFFDKDYTFFSLLPKIGWVNLFTIILDVAVITGISIWYCSIRSGKITAYVRIMSASVLLYSLVDIYWFYLYINNKYIPNSVIDALYMASLLGVAAAATLWSTTGFHFSDETNTKYSNVGLLRKGIYLMILPISFMAVKNFIMTDILIFLLIIFVYEILTINIQSAIRNEALLKKEHALNLELEKYIADRTKELIEKNRELDFISNMDTVTNLFNRRYLIRKLEDTLAQIAPDETLALLFIDMDRFKTINDIYGHHIGDHVLIEVSKRLQKLNHPDACLARFGGDEFVFAFHSDYGYSEVEKLAQQIIKSCIKPIEIGRYKFHVTFSIGISIYPLDARSLSMLMKNADIAMYQAKKLGYNKYVSFNEKLNSAIQRKNEIEILLKRVNFDREFMLYYQPQFSIPDRKLIGMEALLRWNNPEKGFISPGEFIPIAEETDYIIPIGSWVMKRAASQIAAWNNLYNLNLKMAINVSPKQLDQINFINELQSVVSKYSVKPEWLDIEITESMAMDGQNKLPEIARKLQDAGLSISIDDFGTGYSSLSYLKLFSFNRIKIAKQLIDSITTDGYDHNIVKFITVLAKSMGIKTIAEGVEYKEQFDILVDLGIEEIQGYYLGRPIHPSDFEKSYLYTKKPKNLLYQYNKKSITEV